LHLYDSFLEFYRWFDALLIFLPPFPAVSEGVDTFKFFLALMFEGGISLETAPLVAVEDKADGARSPDDCGTGILKVKRESKLREKDKMKFNEL